jgi:hypothetical protein
LLRREGRRRLAHRLGVLLPGRRGLKRAYEIGGPADPIPVALGRLT